MSTPNPPKQDFKRTKIVCTLGPATDNDEVLGKMIDAGMNAARFNLSHGTLDDHFKRLRNVRQIAADRGKSVAAMFDTRGPDMRIGDLETPGVVLSKGNEFILTTKPIMGNDKRVSVNYPGLPGVLHPKDKVFLVDGLIELEVIEISGDEIRCSIVAGGELAPHKGVNTPGITIPLPILTDRDISDLQAGIENGIDYISASFIRSAKDIADIRMSLGGAMVPIIAKIETAQAVANLAEVINAANGAMVARGDLGIEIPPENVPGVQKRIIHTARSMRKPVITATEMLESMVHNPRPTRAEIADVANAVLDGTSAVMLSEESAIGEFPVEAVGIMARTCRAAERDLKFEIPEVGGDGTMSVRSGIAAAAHLLAHDIGASAIVCVTDSGRTAEHFSALKPHQPVLACTPDIRVAQRLALHWGVLPIVIDKQASVETLLSAATNFAKEQSLVKSGDLMVFTGNLSGRGGDTNLLACVKVS